MRILAVAIGAVSLTVASIEAQQAPPPVSPPLFPAPVARQSADGYDPLALPKLDPKAIVAALDVKSMPLGNVLNAIAQASGINLTFDPAVTDLSAPTTLRLSNSTAEDALNLVLGGHGLALRALFPKSAIIYPDTPAGRDKYVESIRTFVLVKADPATLTTLLNRTLVTGVRGQYRPVIVPSRESHSISVRANAPTMAEVARLIAENDKN